MREAKESAEPAEPTARGVREGRAELIRRVLLDCRGWIRRKLRTRGASSLGAGRSIPPFPTYELGEQFELLRTQQTDLATLGKHIEAQFLRISSDLEKLPGESDALVSHSEKMLRLAAGTEKGEPTLETTLGLLKNPLDYVENYHVTTLRFLNTLRQAVEQIDRLLMAEENLQRTVAPLKFIRTMYRVESAALGSAVQGMFLALTEEIQVLQQQVNETFAAKFDALRSDQESLKRLIGRLDQQAGDQGKKMREKRDYLAKAMQDLRTDLEANRLKDLKLTQVTQAISNQVGRLVFSLQAQDVIGQKLAHVLEALENMEEKFSASVDLEDSQTTEILTAASYLSKASVVEAAQLKAVADNLRETDAALCSALDEINTQSKAIDKDCLALDEYENITVSPAGLIQTLLDSLGEVATMVRDAAASSKDAFESISPMGGQATNVTGTMRALSAQIKLIALNAQVQAAHITSGTGLEVLAAQTALIAEDTGRISEQIAGELDAFTKHLDELVKAFDTLREQGIESEQRWKEISAVQEKELHAYRDEALGELNFIGEASKRMRDLVQAMRNRVELKSLADDRVEAPAQTLETIQALLQPLVHANPEHDTEVTYTRSYTMESERQVQEQAVTNSGAPSNPVAIPAEAAADAVARDRLKLVGTESQASDLVLFDDFSSPPATPSSASEAAESVPLATTQRNEGAPATVALTTPPTPPGQPAKSLGDNIELF